MQTRTFVNGRRALGALAGLLVVALSATSVVAAPVKQGERSLGRQAAGAQVLLGTWTTRFIPSDLNGFGWNITYPAKLLDGKVLKPGEKLDFLSSVGPLTAPPYKMGAALRNGKVREKAVIAGGMCSTVTTMFNAALRAGLDITERHNHSLYISRYPVGLDSTVWQTNSGGGQNLEFVNDTGAPITIKTITKRRAVTLQVWGVDDGRTVNLTEPRVEGFVAAKNYMEYTNELKPGEKRKVNDPYDGFKAWVTRTVKDKNGNVIHQETFRSNYKLLDGLIMVGRYKGDPPPGTRILASEYPH